MNITQRQQQLCQGLYPLCCLYVDGTVHVPVQLVSTVIASPTFHAVVSSLSVDDQQFSVVCASYAGMVLEVPPSTLALMVIDAHPRSPLSMS